MKDSILLHIYYDNYFTEIDMGKYDKDRITLGSNTSNNIIINSPAVSNNHILFDLKDDNWHITDLTDNGIIFDGDYIKEKIIKPDDIITIYNSENPDSKAIILVQDKNKFKGKLIKYGLKDISSIKIGRGVTNNIIYKDKLVSGSHAEIYKSGEKEYFINDLKSRNGTFINGRLVKESLLKDGDIIHICGYKIIFKLDYLIIEKSNDKILVKGLKFHKESLPQYPYFLRSPRIEPVLPAGEIEIPKPPPMTSKPSVSWLAILLPPMGMIAVSITMSFVTKNTFIILGTGIMSVVSLAVSLATYFSQKKKYKTTEDLRKKKYFELLDKRNKEIQLMLNSQKEIMNKTHQDIDEYIKMVSTKERLWERTPRHNDFLLLGLGIGDAPFNVVIKAPKSELTIEQDQLLIEAQNIVDKYKIVKDVPVCISLIDAGTVGIVGDRNLMLQATKNLIMQISANHSYDEVKIVIIYHENESMEWEWVRWLPHVWDNNRQIRFLSNEKDSVHKIFDSLYDIIKLRKLRMLDSDSNNLNKIQLPYYVFFIADMHLVENEPILEYLTHNNQKLGISTNFLFNNIKFLPRECRYIVDLQQGKGNLFEKSQPSYNLLFKCDSVPLNKLEEFARKMAPIRIKDLVSPGDLPAKISLFELFNSKSIEDLKIETRWKNSEPYRSLSTPIGLKTNGEKLCLDMHDKFHGPHGLVVGTTGSGKSELLQSLVLSLSINYHPHDIAFLLIDYKGGGMAYAFKELPHVTGIITNLGGNLTNRALLSIKSELTRRQRLFDEYKINHIDKYHQLYKKGRSLKPLPHLIIIIDEFAELKMEQPEFMAELISAVRVGRSLGVHLILATQKPTGVVDDQIWSNAKFRICLRVQDAQDSREVIKKTDAAGITLPGRAYIQVGNNEIFELFQSAYSGTEYLQESDDVNDKKYKICEVLLDGARQEFDTFSQFPKTYEKCEPITQLHAVLNHIKNLVTEKAIVKLPDQWLSPLPEKIYLKELLKDASVGWDGEKWNQVNLSIAPIVGLIDDPANQSQYPLSINFTKAGNLAVYGSPGSGKTTFIQTIIISLIILYSPDDLNLYILDFAGRVLNIFSGLPHVGGVVLLDENEKLQKLIQLILKEIDNRKKLFSEKGVSSFNAYRKSIKVKIPAVVIIVDNFPSLIESYQEMQEYFMQISREGVNLGIYLVLSSGNPSGIGYRINSNINMAVALQMSDKTGYIDIVGRTYGLEPDQVPGRGLVRANLPLEFQTALPSVGENEVERSIELKNMISKMSNVWKGNRARQIPVMPEVILFQDIFGIKKSTKDGKKNTYKIPAGIDFKDLEIQYLNFQEISHYLVTGLPQSGKTNFLKILISALNGNFNIGEVLIYIIDSYSMGLLEFKNSPNIKSYITEPSQLKESIKKIKSILDSRKKEYKKERLKVNQTLPEKDFMYKYPGIFVFIDDYNDFSDMAGDEEKNYLENAILRERGLNFHLIVGGLIDDITSSYEGMTKALKSLQEGLFFGNALEQHLFNIRINYNELIRNPLPGEGYLIKRGNFIKVKIALYK